MRKACGHGALTRGDAALPLSLTRAGGHRLSLDDYRAAPAEKSRTEDLLRLSPQTGGTALDIGARDGHFSLLFAQRFANVVALDLSQPTIDHPNVTCVKGNAADMPFDTGSMDFVFCAEVLEHIPPDLLQVTCKEIQRVGRGNILIGVPYKQDTRVGRTTCYSCGAKNPPWGHVNSFDEARLAALFSDCVVQEISFVGTTTEQTNEISARLLDWAGNPYGTYTQDEPCIRCNAPLLAPPERSLGKKVLTKLGYWARKPSTLLASPRGNWMHVLFSKRSSV